MTNLFRKLLLKPLFDAVAKAGIGLPHSDFETDLILAGKKPALITGWPLRDTPEDKYTKLQPFVDSGDIVLIGTHSKKVQSNVICTPQHLDSARKYATTERKFLENVRPDEEELQHYHAFRKEFLMTANGQEFCDRANDLDAPRKETDRLLKGEIKATVPLWVGEDFKFVPKDIREKIQSGELHAVTVQSYDSLTAVLSPKSSVDAGRELYARCWTKAEDYPTLDVDDSTKRIGQLLGYTEADTALFTRIQKIKHSELGLRDRLHVACYPMLRYARAQSLLMDDPTPL